MTCIILTLSSTQRKSMKWYLLNERSVTGSRPTSFEYENFRIWGTQKDSRDHLLLDCCETLLSESLEANANKKPVDFAALSTKLFSASREPNQHILVNLMFYLYFSFTVAKTP